MSIQGDIEDDDPQLFHNAFDETTHQGCYIFEPAQVSATDFSEHPSKKRKLSKSAKDTRHEEYIFPLLFRGAESAESAQLRQRAFQDLWSSYENKLNQVLKYMDETAVTDVRRFVKESGTLKGNGGIPTGLIITGSDYSVQNRLLERWKSLDGAQPVEEVITIDSTQAPNLMIALKSIIRSVISQRHGLDGYQSFLTTHKKLIPSNFDLELLQLFAEQEGIQRIVISILEVEVFEVGLLIDLISVLSSWMERIPFVLLLGIATTVEILEARLPKATIKLLNGRVFNVSSRGDRLYDIYKTIQDDNETKLWLGPNISAVLLEKAADQDETPHNIRSAIQFCYMSHFFANPLSVLLSDSAVEKMSNSTDLYNAIRNTGSFRKFVDKQLKEQKTKAVKRLLEDDKYLLSEARNAIIDGQDRMINYRKAIQFFISLYKVLPTPSKHSFSGFEIDNEAFSGRNFLSKELYLDGLLSFRELSSDEMDTFLAEESSSDFEPELIASTLADVRSLRKVNKDTPIYSAYSSTRSGSATSISQTNIVSLSKQTTKLTKVEKEYTAIVDRLYDVLRKQFEAKIIDINDLFLHEVFVYDLKMPLATSFTPRPRYVIERALDHPSDYLGCECCSGSDVNNDSTGRQQPATSLLWQLLCEAGSIVNVRDLWEAFSATIVDRKDEDEDDEDGAGADIEDGAGDSEGKGLDGHTDERMALALFYRGLADLRMLGFVKPTKRRADCIARVTWRGL